eukprot:3333340-Pyramimonas_sp.AAC.1
MPLSAKLGTRRNMRGPTSAVQHVLYSYVCTHARLLSALLSCSLLEYAGLCWSLAVSAGLCCSLVVYGALCCALLRPASL